jgi:hypothetical protein
MTSFVTRKFVTGCCSVQSISNTVWETVHTDRNELANMVANMYACHVRGHVTSVDAAIDLLPIIN